MTYLKPDHPNHETASKLAALAGQHDANLDVSTSTVEGRDERRGQVTEMVRSAGRPRATQAGAFIEAQFDGSDPRIATDVLAAIRNPYF